MDYELLTVRITINDDAVERVTHDLVRIMNLATTVLHALKQQPQTATPQQQEAPKPKARPQPPRHQPPPRSTEVLKQAIREAAAEAAAEGKPLTPNDLIGIGASCGFVKYNCGLVASNMCRSQSAPLFKLGSGENALYSTSKELLDVLAAQNSTPH